LSTVGITRDPDAKHHRAVSGYLLKISACLLRRRERVENLALEVFGNAAKANAWLDAPWEKGCRLTARQMLDCSEGLVRVERALIQIDEGIYP
jgi:uncharacterized protein (DUF2384 family)